MADTYRDQNLWRLLAEASEQALCVCDGEGRLRLANPAAEDLFGVPAGHLESRLLTDLIEPDVSEPGVSPLSLLVTAPVVRARFHLRGQGDDDAVAVSVRRLDDQDSSTGAIVSFERIAPSEPDQWRASKEVAWSLLNATSDMALFLRVDGTILGVNRRCAEEVGRPVEELVGTSVFDHAWPEDRERRRDLARRAAETGEMIRYEEHARGKVYDTTIWPVPGDDGAVSRLAVFIQDITLQKQDQERADRMARGLRAVVDVADELMSAPDLDTLLRRAVEAAREELGFERTSIFLDAGELARGSYGTDHHGRTSDEREVVIRKDVEPEGDMWQALLRVRGPEEPRWIVRHVTHRSFGDGEPLVMGEGWVVGTPIQTTDKVIGVLFNDAASSGSAIDQTQQEVMAVYCSLLANIIERKRAEDAVCFSEQIYRSTVDAISDWVHVVDRDMRIVTYSGGFRRKIEELGLPGEMRGLKLTDAMPFLPESVFGEYRQVIQTGRPTLTSEVTAIEGVRYVTETSKLPVFEDGEVARVVTVMRDVTAVAQAEELLRDSQETAWALLNASSECALLLDSNYDILGINQAAAALLGGPLDELVGTAAVSHLEEGVQAERLARLHEATANRRPVRFEDDYLGRRYLNSLYPILDGEGEVAKMAVFSHDLTDVKRAEDSQRLAAVGQLAAGVAHEFNNLLAIMSGRAQLAHGAETGDQYRELVGTVLRATRRGAAICRNLTRFARPQAPERLPLVIEEAIESALSMAEREIRNADVELRRDYRRGDCQVLGDAVQLEQVFLNLFINACHAMPAGGTLCVATRSDLSEDGCFAVVSVTDTGVGIPEDHLPRVFEPFFTTKGRLGDSEVPGSGLGLSVSHGILQAHGADVDVTSKVGRGTTFTMRFPSSPGPATPQVVERPDDASARSEERSHKRVLVAEDEDDLRDLLLQVFAGAGYETVAVASADAALREADHGEFDAVVADLLMPAGGGPAILKHLRDKANRPPVLIITGRADRAAARDALELGAEGCITKPFSVTDLLDAVADLIEAGPAQARPASSVES